MMSVRVRRYQGVHRGLGDSLLKWDGIVCILMQTMKPNRACTTKVQLQLND